MGATETLFPRHAAIFLQSHASIRRAEVADPDRMMADLLHLTPKDCQTWGEAVLPDIEQLMR